MVQDFRGFDITIALQLLWLTKRIFVNFYQQGIFTNISKIWNYHIFWKLFFVGQNEHNITEGTRILIAQAYDDTSCRLIYHTIPDNSRMFWNFLGNVIYGNS